MVDKYKLNKISPEIIKVRDCDLTQDFVSILIEVDSNGLAFHSGLLICFEEKLKYFHYTGTTIELEEVDQSICDNSRLYKNLKIIHPLDVVSFLGHCEKLIKIGVSPKYGFVFNNSYYDSQTKESFLINAKHDITTCVGFCIKVIRGFLFNNPEYLKLDDWNISSLDDVNPSLLNFMNTYLQSYILSNNIDPKELFSQDELKRISPSELFSSAFYTNLPITKESIDFIKSNVDDDIKQKVA